MTVTSICVRYDSNPERISIVPSIYNAVVILVSAALMCFVLHTSFPNEIERLYGNTPLSVGISQTIALIIIMNYFFFTKIPTKCLEEVEAKIEVLPLGIQIVRSIIHKRGDNRDDHLYQSIQSQCFIAHEDIIDVIISEVVLSYKVFSCIHFRVKKRERRQHHCSNLQSDQDKIQEKSGDSPSNYMRTGKISLIPAFPDLEMSYNECEKLWADIMTALGKQ